MNHAKVVYYIPPAYNSAHSDSLKEYPNDTCKTSAYHGDLSPQHGEPGNLTQFFYFNSRLPGYSKPLAPRPLAIALVSLEKKLLSYALSFGWCSHLVPDRRL